jgi:hypothetical protein
MIGRPRWSVRQGDHKTGSNAEKHAEAAFATISTHVLSPPHLVAPSPMMENGPQNAG